MKRALLLLAIVVAPATSRAGDAVVAQSTHYRLVSTGPQDEADDWARMLEAAWPQYAEFFGKTPPLAKDERLSVACFEDGASMEAAIRKAGGVPPGVGEGGYYDPVSKAAYLFRQPSPWYTRALMLHECAHQFHWRAKGLKASPPFWYGEGVAEHLSRHAWNGAELRLGVVPILSLEKYASKALEAMKAPDFDVEKTFAGGTDRPLAMELVAYLLRGEGGKLRPKFDDIAARLDRGGKLDASAAASALGPLKKFGAAWRAWVETVQEPWEVLTIDWDARAADALRGSSPEVVAMCRRRAETSKIAATLRFVGAGPRNGGLLLRYASREEYDLLMIRGARVRVERRQDGKWTTSDDEATPPAADGAWRVEAVREGGVVRCSVNGVIVAELEAPPASMGLALDASTVDFTSIDAK